MKISYWLLYSGITSILFSIILIIAASAYPMGVMKAYPDLPDRLLKNDIIQIPSVGSLYKTKSETTDEYYIRLSNTLRAGILNFWGKDDTKTSKADYTRVSFWDNYLLWAYSYLPGHEHFSQYEFALPKKVIGRGYGLCSQLTRMTYYILEEQNMPAKVSSQVNHVVVEVPEGVIDPYYGTFVPYSSIEIKNNVEILNKYFDVNDKTLSKVKGIFSNNWDVPQNHDELYAYMMKVEVIAEILKWLLPAVLFGYGLLSLLFWQRAKKKAL